MISKTSITSTSGVTLISLTGPLPEPALMPMADCPSYQLPALCGIAYLCELGRQPAKK
jgi:hypothetical protein